jgi:hypothetical protein
MGKINWSRIVLGGMFSGLVLIVLSSVSTALFGRQQALRRAVDALRPSTTGIGTPVFFLSVILILGMLMTWWYAAIRPLFGPGLKTAAMAGLAMWLTAIWLGVVGFAFKSLAMGEPYALPSGPMLPVLYLVIMVASTIAGAWLYKERQS